MSNKVNIPKTFPVHLGAKEIKRIILELEEEAASNKGATEIVVRNSSFISMGITELQRRTARKALIVAVFIGVVSVVLSVFVHTSGKQFDQSLLEKTTSIDESLIENFSETRREDGNFQSPW
jgi:hypothetical protein